jgi:hypothetical protein
VSDLQHAQTSDGVIPRWRDTRVSSDGTHHVRHGVALYPTRFDAVQKFHAPGLAPARDHSGAFHITDRGEAAYDARFHHTWGFYDLLAAAKDADGWLHIRPDGAALYAARFAWVGNFQEYRCAVRDSAGAYFHITDQGTPAYRERHRYVGDFRDGIAVARFTSDDLCGHIDADGREVYSARFLELDVLHKGLARARDERGWFHVDVSGRALYSNRFVAVEPFYNGTALAEQRDGGHVLIDDRGQPVLAITREAEMTGEATKVLLIGNIGSGKSTLAHALRAALGWPGVGIDQCRHRFSDGSPAGELAAWSAFARHAGSRTNSLLEFSGSGSMAYLIEKALADSGARVVVLWLDAPVTECLQRTVGREWSTPYPDFGVPMSQVVADLGTRLQSELHPASRWRGMPLWRLDAMKQPATVAAEALDIIRRLSMEASA